MQFTESEIQEILRENSILKKDLADAREELEATGRLYDTMVVGTRNLLILIDEGSRSPSTGERVYPRLITEASQGSKG